MRRNTLRFDFLQTCAQPGNIIPMHGKCSVCPSAVQYCKQLIMQWNYILHVVHRLVAIKRTTLTQKFIFFSIFLGQTKVYHSLQNRLQKSW